VSATGAPVSGALGSQPLSAGARFVAFDSLAIDLVNADTHGVSQVYVRDLVSGATELVSVGAVGGASGASASASISADGRLVAFASRATDLVSAPLTGTGDVFVRNRTSGTVVVASLTPELGAADGPSSEPTLSSDGRVVAFTSSASDLVSGDANATTDVFVRDLETATTTRASVDSAGREGSGDSGAPALSADGRFVVFFSTSPELLAVDRNGGAGDVFVRDRAFGSTELVSAAADGTQGFTGSGGPGLQAVSADGRFVSFASRAQNLAPGANGFSQVLVRDRLSGSITLASTDDAGVPGLDDSTASALSADGRFVAFTSAAPNLVPDDTNGAINVFVRDLTTGRTARVDVPVAAGQTPTGSSARSPAISPDGAFVAFVSTAANLTDPAAGVGVPAVFVVVNPLAP
jgi:Tol biopolymer transport system component